MKTFSLKILVPRILVSSFSDCDYELIKLYRMQAVATEKVNKIIISISSSQGRILQDFHKNFIKKMSTVWKK